VNDIILSSLQEGMSLKEVLQTYPEQALAIKSQPIVKLQIADNGVEELALTMNGSHYGVYPVSAKHDALGQIRMMMADALDYGFGHIILDIE